MRGRGSGLFVGWEACRILCGGSISDVEKLEADRANPGTSLMSREKRSWNMIMGHCGSVNGRIHQRRIRVTGRSRRVFQHRESSWRRTLVGGAV